MGTSGHAARTQSDGTATRNGGMVPWLLTTTLGCRLPAWSYASGRDPRTRLCGCLLNAGSVSFTLAPAACDGHDRVKRSSAAGGNTKRAGPQTSFTASVGCAVKQIPHRFDSCTGRNCGRFQTAVSRLRGDAEIGFELSLPPARGQAGARAENWHSCADALVRTLEKTSAPSKQQ